MNRQKGFTLVEAAVAIGVVAILSGIIIPLVLKNIRDSRHARARNDINVIVAAIASQMKDMGARPMAAGGPGNADGSADAIWYSPGTIPALTGAGGRTLVAPGGLNTFEHLFTAPMPVAGGPALVGNPNTLFGFPAAPAAEAEFKYKGHYLTNQAAMTTDPWGNAYIILGYNQHGMAANGGNGGPIWVVSAGEAGTIDVANVVAGGAVPLAAGPLAAVASPEAWDYTDGSRTNIAVQVH